MRGRAAGSGLAAAVLALGAAAASAAPIDRSVIPPWHGTAPLSGPPATSVVPAWHGAPAAPEVTDAPDSFAPQPAPGSALSYGGATPGPATWGPAAAASTFPTAAPDPATATAGSPIPQPRPTTLATDTLVLASLIPLPRPRTLSFPKATLQPASAATPMQPLPAQPEAGQGGLCGDPSLVGQMRVPVVSTNPACGIESPVSLTSVAGVRLSHPATVDCETARALSAWMRGAVLPAGQAMGQEVARVDVGDTYACRPRNNVAGNKVSEHGKGHAFDVMSFGFATGDQVVVLDDWGQGAKGRFLSQIRRAACGTFTTVLGPGSDPYHRNHLHLDTARGRGPYCR